MKKSLSFIHRANKLATTEIDLIDKARIQNILREYFGVPALMDEVIYIEKKTGKIGSPDPKIYRSKEEVWHDYFVQLPDLQINVLPKPTVVEIDGDVHWQNKKAIKRTNERNLHYEQAEITMLWFTRKEVRELSTAGSPRPVDPCRFSRPLGHDPGFHPGRARAAGLLRPARDPDLGGHRAPAPHEEAEAPLP